MARQARAALADSRALEEQTFRQQMHGGAFYGAGMKVGGGATPSMGLSQFRGGMCHKCECDDCECSDSDEEKQGGSLYSSVASALGKFGSTAASRAAAAARASAQTAANARAAVSGTSALNRARLALTNAPSSTLALRAPPSSALALRAPPSTALTRTNLGAYDEALDLRGVTGTAASAAARTTVASRLARMGITPARVAAALAAGVALGSLEAYFRSQQGAPGGEYIVDWPPGGGDDGPYGPYGPGGPGGPGTGGPSPDDLAPGTPKKVVAAYLRSGNAPSRYLIGSQARKMALAESEGAISGGFSLASISERLRPQSQDERTISNRPPPGPQYEIVPMPGVPGRFIRKPVARPVPTPGPPKGGYPFPIVGMPPSRGPVFDRSPFPIVGMPPGSRPVQQLFGSGSGKRNRRAEVVKRVMAEQGLSLPQASKYVKENGIEY
jgi:hypothetical protein